MKESNFVKVALVIGIALSALTFFVDMGNLGEKQTLYLGGHNRSVSSRPNQDRLAQQYGTSAVACVHRQMTPPS